MFCLSYLVGHNRLEVSTGSGGCSHQHWMQPLQLEQWRTVGQQAEAWDIESSMTCLFLLFLKWSVWVVWHDLASWNDHKCYQLLSLEPFGICCSCCRLRYVLQVLPGDERWQFVEVGVCHACQRPIMIIFVLFRLRKCSSILAYKHPVLNPWIHHLIFFILISFLENKLLE